MKSLGDGSGDDGGAGDRDGGWEGEEGLFGLAVDLAWHGTNRPNYLMVCFVSAMRQNERESLVCFYPLLASTNYPRSIVRFGFSIPFGVLCSPLPPPSLLLSLYLSLYLSLPALDFLRA